MACACVAETDEIDRCQCCHLPEDECTCVCLWCDEGVFDDEHMCLQGVCSACMHLYSQMAHAVLGFPS